MALPKLTTDQIRKQFGFAPNLKGWTAGEYDLTPAGGIGSVVVVRFDAGDRSQAYFADAVSWLRFARELTRALAPSTEDEILEALRRIETRLDGRVPEPR